MMRFRGANTKCLGGACPGRVEGRGFDILEDEATTVPGFGQVQTWMRLSAESPILHPAQRDGGGPQRDGGPIPPKTPGEPPPILPPPGSNWPDCTGGEGFGAIQHRIERD